MKVTLNGEQIELIEKFTILDLIKSYEIDPEKVAIEKNLAIVPSSNFGNELICDGDQIEMVHFIGGG